jgi:hypothetical protein
VGLDEQVAERLRHRARGGTSSRASKRRLALVHPAERHADAGRLDRQQGVLHVHAVAGEAGAVGLHGQLGHAEHPLDADVAGALDAAHGAADRLAERA